ncbi:MAG: purine-binding chemotaxis protein CheW [bacterium]|nr:purine-binding chemotaxis protein CheW [bacterium]
MSEISLACFEAGERFYALDVKLVREIVRTQPITPLPNAPELIEGVVDLRGGLIPVLDLARVLGTERSELKSTSRIVVLDYEGMLLGLCVDAATDVLSVDPAQLEEVPDLAAQAGYDVVRSVVRREDAAPVMVLAVETILESVYRSTQGPVEGNG